VVFVADSQRYMLDQNKDSLSDLRRNLKANGLDYRTIPLVLQYNKRDLPDILPISDLDAALNDRQSQTFSASAIRGAGVVETLRAVTLLVFKTVRDGGLSEAPASKAPQPTNQRKPSAQSGSRPAHQAPSPTTRAAREMPAVNSPAASPVNQLPRPPDHSTSSPPPAGAAAQQQATAQRSAPQAQGKLSDQVSTLVAKAEEGSPVMPTKEDIGYQEFQNLAVLHHKLQERVAQMEKELTRLTQEHQDLKRLVGKKLL